MVALVLGVLFAAFEALEGDMELKMGSREGEMEGSGTRILPKWSPWGSKREPGRPICSSKGVRRASALPEWPKRVALGC